VPIQRPGKNKGKVAIVMQAMSKLLEPRFDADFDGEVLRLIGVVAVELSEVCEANNAHRANFKRKEVLLQIFDDHLPCCDSGQVLHALETGLHKMFRAQAVALLLVDSRGRGANLGAAVPQQRPQRQRGQRHTVHPQLERTSSVQAMAPRRLLRVRRDGLRGIVGHVARTQELRSFSSSQLEESMYDAMADLPVPDGMVHTVPIVDDGTCAAICQFVCPEREGTMLVDDGCFHAENPEHTGLLHLLLTFVQRHLRVFSLGGRREYIEEEDEEEEDYEEEEEEESSEEEADEDLDDEYGCEYDEDEEYSEESEDED